MNGTPCGIIGLLLGLVFAFGFDNYYFRPSWEENAKKQEQLKQYTYLAQMGYGEYQLDKYTGYSTFVWYGPREYLKHRFPRLSDREVEAIIGLANCGVPCLRESGK